MMTTDKLAELYKRVLLLEERLELTREAAKKASKTDTVRVQLERQKVSEANNALAAARKEFSDAVTSYNRVHRNIPFYRRSKTYSVKLQSKTIRFYFDQHGIPTTV